MKYLVVVMAIIAMNSERCKNIDDSAKVCTESCTIIHGYFLEPGEKGVGNLSYELYSSTMDPFTGTHKRKIAVGKTNSVGEYSMKVKLKDSEIGSIPNSKLYLSFKYDTTKYTYPSKYEYGVQEYLGDIERRDTSLLANVYLVPKGKINVRLTGFISQTRGDNFSVMAICKCGIPFKDQYKSVVDVIFATGGVQQQLTACGNDETLLTVTRRKNDVETRTDTTIATPLGSVKEISFAY